LHKYLRKKSQERIEQVILKLYIDQDDQTILCKFKPKNLKSMS
jgi:hypothetical protein